jgi:hypothetical protein
MLLDVLDNGKKIFLFWKASVAGLLKFVPAPASAD